MTTSTTTRSAAREPLSGTTVLLPRTENQAVGLARYCLDFLRSRNAAGSETGGSIGRATLDRVEQFHLDSVGCGVSALAHRANAPTVLRREALGTPPSVGSRGGICLGSTRPCAVEKAVAANASAVREWDSNGTNFGYDAAKGRIAGEFGHNDFYPVAVAAAREAGLDGDATLRVMLLIDEIRGRLAEVFALRKYSIDHVHHGAVACAAAFTAAVGGTVEQIESAIGMVVAHYVPFRAIRAGHQLSDSKGASAALSAEVAVMSARRALAGFLGPRDVFRNALAIYRLNEPCPNGQSPFDLELGLSGDAFAIHAMHFKLGLYEHQSAGAIQAIVDACAARPDVARDLSRIRAIRVKIYEPAYSIIADPAKRTPATRQSADHSLPFILAKTLLKITIEHGGVEYDALYPDGIPTSVEIDHDSLGLLGGGLVRYPLGHARSDADHTAAVVALKFDRLVAGAVDDPARLRERLRVAGRRPEEIAELYAFPIHGCDPG